MRKQRASGTIKTDTEIEKSELDIIKHLVGLPEMIADAGKNQSPALVSNYSYELVKLYNSFYQSVSIFKEEDEEKQKMRLLLTQQVSETVEFTMRLLGICVPVVIRESQDPFRRHMKGPETLLLVVGQLFSGRKIPATRLDRTAEVDLPAVRRECRGNTLRNATNLDPDRFSSAASIPELV